MKQKPTITYIKNNEEKTITLNLFTIPKQLMELYLITFDFYDGKIYKIKDDIQFIHFKNFSFQNISEIRCAYDTICILEDCTFSKKSYLRRSLYLDGGSFEVIDPILINIEGIDAKTFFPQQINVIYTKKIQNKDKKIKISSGSTIGYSSETTMLRDENNINKISVLSDNIVLENNFQLGSLELEGKNVTIGNNDEQTTIINSSNFPHVYPKLGIEASESLQLINCVIESDYHNGIMIESPRIEVKNVTLKSQNANILINENEFKKQDNEELVVTDKDILRASLMNCLVSRKERLEQLIESKKNQILENSSFPEQKQLIDLRIQIHQKEREIKQLQQQLQQKGKVIVKSLAKKSGKYLIDREESK